MRTVNAIWFECKVRFEKVVDNGTQKKVTEQYVVNAMSFTEAEKRIVEEVSQYIQGEYEVVDIKKAAYKEVFFMDYGEKVLSNGTEELLHAVKKGDKEEGRRILDRPLEEALENTDTRWYKAKLQFITMDEKTEKEKRSNVSYLVEACSLHNALDNIDSVMRGTMIDYVQANVAETQIMDVI